MSAAVLDGMRDRGLVGDDGWLSEPGRAVKQRVDALTDDLAAKSYESLGPGELDELMATLEPVAALLLAAQYWDAATTVLFRDIVQGALAHE